MQNQNDALPAGGEQPFLTVKYDGEERPLTKEEAKSLAQKGLNYERVLGQRDSFAARAKELEAMLASSPAEGQRLQEDWLRFLAQYPDIKPEQQLSPEVWQRMEEGASPAEAYATFLNERLAEQLAEVKAALSRAQKQNETRQKSPGSNASVTGFAAGADPFLEGLLTGY